MSDLADSPALGYLLALTIGFIVGRTREPEPEHPPRPGIRDFLIIALIGASSAHLGQIALSVTAFAATAAFIALMRLHHAERTGITTELSAIATFVLAYLCMTPMRAVAAGLAIVLATVLARKDAIRRLVREEISDDEYLDTLSFLGLIFIIYPLLPQGGFGPYEFFEPRRIWLFIILVSGVSYVGYFLTKFTGTERGALLTAMVGALTSTTAYTTAVSRAVKDAPETAVPAARNAIIGNTILFPRMLVIISPISPALALAGVPAFAAMTAAGFLAALILGRAASAAPPTEVPASTFRNPFTLIPALKFGVVFTAVLLLARVARQYVGAGGQMAVWAVSGLVDVDAISLTLAGFVQSGSNVRDAVIGMTLAAGVNAIFKSAVAQSSGQPTFYLRLMLGFVAMFAVGAAVIALLDPARVAELMSHLQTA